MQEEFIPEIPEEEPEIPLMPKKKQSCADVFFMQYLVCIIILTILFSVRLWDGQSFQNAVQCFNQQIHADSVPELIHFLEQVRESWN